MGAVNGARENEAGENTGPKGATLAALLTELSMLTDEIAVFEYYAARVFADFADDDGGAHLLIQMDGRAAARADTNAVVKVQAMLESAAAKSRDRLQEILSVTVPGQVAEGSGKRFAQCVVRVIPANDAAGRERCR